MYQKREWQTVRAQCVYACTSRIIRKNDGLELKPLNFLYLMNSAEREREIKIWVLLYQDTTIALTNKFYMY